MKKRAPLERRLLRNKLRMIAELDRSGAHDLAQMAYEKLPAEARGVIALLIYAGRLGKRSEGALRRA